MKYYKNLYKTIAPYLFFIATFFFLSYLIIDKNFTMSQNSFYHQKIAMLYSQGNFNLDKIPSFKGTTFEKDFVNQHSLYHFMLIPFVKIFKAPKAMKVATSFFITFLIMGLYLLFKSLKVNFPLFWASTALFLQGGAYQRLFWERPEPIILLFFVLFLFLIFNESKRSYLFLIGNVFLLASMSYFALILPFIYLAHTLFFREYKKRSKLYIFLCLMLAFLIGISLGPHPVFNFNYFIDLLRANLQNKAEVKEWLPNVSFMKSYWIYNLLYFTSLILFFSNKLKMNKILNFIIVITFCFLLLTTHIRRFEFLYCFLAITSFILSINLIKVSKVTKRRFILYPIIGIFIALSSVNFIYLKKHFKGNNKTSSYNFSPFYKWYKKSKLKDERFINAKWVYWSELFFLDHMINSARGFSPSIEKKKTSNLFKSLSQIESFSYLDYKNINRLYQSNLILVDKNSTFYQKIILNKSLFNNFTKEYEDSSTVFLKIKDDILNSESSKKILPGKYRLTLNGVMTKRKFHLDVSFGSKLYNFGIIGNSEKLKRKSFIVNIEKESNLSILANNKIVPFNFSGEYIKSDDGLSKHSFNVNDDFYLSLTPLIENKGTHDLFPVNNKLLLNLVNEVQSCFINECSKISNSISLKYNKIMLTLINLKNKQIINSWHTDTSKSLSGDILKLKGNILRQFDKTFLNNAFKDGLYQFKISLFYDKKEIFHPSQLENFNIQHAFELDFDKKSFFFPAFNYMSLNMIDNNLLKEFLSRLNLTITSSNDYKFYKYKEISMINGRMSSGNFSISNYNTKQMNSIKNSAIKVLLNLFKNSGDILYSYNPIHNTYIDSNNNLIRKLYGAYTICNSLNYKENMYYNDAKKACAKSFKYFTSQLPAPKEIDNLGKLSMLGLLALEHYKHFKKNKTLNNIKDIYKQVLLFYDNALLKTHRGKVIPEKEIFYPGEALVFLSRVSKELGIYTKQSVNIFLKTFDYYNKLFLKYKSIYMMRWHIEALSNFYFLTKNKSIIDTLKEYHSAIKDITGKNFCIVNIPGRDRNPIQAIGNMNGTILEGALHLSKIKELVYTQDTIDRLLKCTLGTVLDTEKLPQFSKDSYKFNGQGGFPLSLTNFTIRIDTHSHSLNSLIDSK